MMQKKPLNIFFSLILLFLLTGCATMGNRGSSELEEGSYAPAMLTAASKLRFSDLPHPAAFKLIQDKSFIFQTEGTRVALLKYAGRAKVEDLVRFYREQMPLYNWELLNTVEYGNIILNFERDNQSCIVTIEPKAIKKIVTVSVAPKYTASPGSQAEVEEVEVKVGK